MVYLDYNATTPLAPEVQKAIQEALTNFWANPSCSYRKGVQCKKAIISAREELAHMIGARDSDIVFTSGGTESNHLVFHSLIRHYHESQRTLSKGEVNGQLLPSVPHFITTNIEHDSVRLPLKQWMKEGIVEVTFVPVSTETGEADINELLNAIRSNTCLISMMLANNETGIIQPVGKLGEALKILNGNRSLTVFLHTDAAQAIGKIPVEVLELGVHYLTIVGHKFYGPRIGALYVRDLNSKKTPLYPLFYGGGQERGFRPGTENTALIIGLGTASRLVKENLDQYQNHMTDIRDYLEASLKKNFGQEITFNKRNKLVDRLPNTCSISFSNCLLTGSEILKSIPDLEASTGSACHAGSNQSASPVLLASGVLEHLAKSTLRLSVGRETTKEDIDLAATLLLEAIIR